jgi:hypothetical protein
VGLQGNFTGQSVDLAWTAPQGAVSFTVARIFAGSRDRKTFNSVTPAFTDAVGFLPPNFSVNYEVFANYSDNMSSPAKVTVVTPDVHPVANLTAKLENNGRSVKVTWSAASTVGYPLDHLYLAGVGGTPGSRTVPSSASNVTLSALPPGTYTYAMLGYYSVPGVGVVESNPETAPRVTFRIPHCVLLYRRALHEMQLKPSFWFDPPEVLLLARGERKKFNIEWKHASDHGTDAERYGSHLREATNDGVREIELSLYNSIAGGVSIQNLKPGETKTFMLDLAGVWCL